MTGVRGAVVPRVKICCISSDHEAALAVACGAAALGLVSEMPSGPGVVDEARIERIIATVPPAVATFLLTSATAAPRIAAQQRSCFACQVAPIFSLCERFD